MQLGPVYLHDKVTGSGCGLALACVIHSLVTALVAYQLGSAWCCFPWGLVGLVSHGLRG